jgi:hypothetical protein
MRDEGPREVLRAAQSNPKWTDGRVWGGEMRSASGVRRAAQTCPGSVKRSIGYECISEVAPQTIASWHVRRRVSGSRTPVRCADSPKSRWTAVPQSYL